MCGWALMAEAHLRLHLSLVLVPVLVLWTPSYPWEVQWGSQYFRRTQDMQREDSQTTTRC